MSTLELVSLDLFLLQGPVDSFALSEPSLGFTGCPLPPSPAASGAPLGNETLLMV